MALSKCLPISTDAKGRELVEHGTDLFPVACYHDDLREEGVAWHWHEELEVFVVESGTAKVSVNGIDYVAKQGDGFFVNSGALHGVWQYGEEQCLLRSIVFHPRFVGGSVDSVVWQKYLEPLLSNPSLPCFCFSNTLDEAVSEKKNIDEAWNLCILEEDGFEFGMRELLSKVVLFLSKQARSLSSSKRNLSPKALRDGERTKTMLKYIQEHYNEDISLRQIAESANVCESECLRCFRNVIGCSPIRYVKQLRLQKAAELLRCSTWKISDIGMECGFQEMSYFAKAFREAKGCTPHEFREGTIPNVGLMSV